MSIASIRKRLDLGGKFSRMAKWTASKTGHPAAFSIALLIVLIWGLSGPIYNYSDTWQLIINTGTTIVTCLMLFLLQNSQNRDSAALQVKLDELIRVTRGAHNRLLEIEDMNYEELDELRARYEMLASRAKKDIEHGRRDTGTPELRGLSPENERGVTKRASRRTGAILNGKTSKKQITKGKAVAAQRPVAVVDPEEFAPALTNGAAVQARKSKPKKSVRNPGPAPKRKATPSRSESNL